MSVEFLGGGGDEFDWDEWIRKERSLEQSDPPQIEAPPSVQMQAPSQDVQRPDDGNNAPPAPDPTPTSAPAPQPSVSFEDYLRANVNGKDEDSVIRQEADFLRSKYGDPGNIPREVIDSLSTRAGRPTASNGGVGGDADTNGDGRIDPGWTQNAGGQFTRSLAPVAPPRPGALGSQAVSSFSQPQANVGAQFSDPITKMIEEFAQRRAQERENPSAGSGQALLEQALRDMAGQFQAGGYTPGEQEIFQTQAIDPLERLRTARKQQVMQQLSARGIDPRSGVAIQMLADVDRQFDAQRGQIQAGIAGRGAEEKTARMQQAIQLLSALSQGENARLNEGFQYRTVPMNLADRAFGQAQQVWNMNETSANNAQGRAFNMFNAAGNPLTLAQPLMQLQQMQQGRIDNWQEALGYLAAMMAS